MLQESYGSVLPVSIQSEGQLHPTITVLPVVVFRKELCQPVYCRGHSGVARVQITPHPSAQWVTADQSFSLHLV